MKWFLLITIAAGCGGDQLDCMDECVDAYGPCREEAEKLPVEIEKQKAYLQCLNAAAACIGECDAD